MKNIKKHVSILLTLLLLFSVAVPVSVSADTSGNWTYTLSGSNATITGYSGPNGEVTIPSEIDGYAVKSIGQNALQYKYLITSITIPGSVTSIGNYAFRGCTGLTDITISNGVTSIGTYAFQSCTKLTSITIPDSVTSIGASAFYDCAALTSAIISNNVTTINESLFASCSNLESVTLGSSVSSMGNNVFNNCTKLTSLTLPASFSSFSNTASNSMGYFSNLEEINVESGNAKFSSDNGILYNKAKTNLIYCPHGKSGSVTVPNGVSQADDSAFDGTSVTSVSLPASFRFKSQYGEYNVMPFYGCNTLTSVNIDPDNPWFSSDDGIVYNDSKTRLIFCPRGKTGTLTIPDTVTSINLNACNACTGLTSVVMPNGVTKIGDQAFYCCTSLTSVTIPGGGSTGIGANSFYNCTSLTDLTISSGVQSVGDTAFANCTALTHVELPESVSRINSYAFQGCTNLAEVTILNKNATIGNYYVFRSCSPDLVIYGRKGSTAETYAANNDITFAVYLPYSPDYNYYLDDDEKAVITLYKGTDTQVEIPSAFDDIPVKSVGTEAFANNTSVTSVTIPGSVTAIGNNAFNGCSALETVTIAAGNGYYSDFASIGDYAFRDCTSLATVSTPNLRTLTIGEGAFYNCTDITRLDLLSKVTEIGDYAFYGCTNLSGTSAFSYSLDGRLRIPSCTSLGSYAFENCASLSEVYFSDSITALEEGVFSNCTGLRTISWGDEVTSIGDKAFMGCTSLRSETIPGHVTSIGNEAFKDCTGLASVTISNGVASIGDGAFEGCTGLTAISFPESVTTIGGGAFSGCTGFTEVTIPATVNGVGSGAFEDCTGIKNVTVSGSAVSISNDAFEGCTSLTALTTDGSCNYNNSNVLTDMITDLTITGAAAKESGFTSWPNLKNVTIAKGVGTIGASAFSSCANLESLTIPRSVTSIGKNIVAGDPKVIIYGYDSSAADTYAGSSLHFVPIIYSSKGSDYTYDPLSSTQLRDSGDNSFGITQETYGNIELLGVQKKTGVTTNDMRFIAVVNDGIIEAAASEDGDIVDYGFVLAKSQYVSTLSASEDYISKITLDAANTLKCSCVGTENDFSGNYGKIASTTRYKYVTLAVKNVSENTGFAARFYVKTRSGRVYYADYSTYYTGCVTSYARLSATAHSNSEGENSTWFKDGWLNMPSFTV